MNYDLEKNKKIEGWMDDSDLLWLYETAKEMESIVEIGCWKGKSTYALLSGCKGIVYAIDHFKGSENSASKSFYGKPEDIYNEFQNNIKGFDNCIVFKDNSKLACQSFSDMSVDMVFIDGDHSIEGTNLDIINWLPKTIKLICGHDYAGNFASKEIREKIKIEGGTFVKKVVDALFKNYELTESGEIWYKRI